MTHCHATNDDPRHQKPSRWQRLSPPNAHRADAAIEHLTTSARRSATARSRASARSPRRRPDRLSPQGSLSAGLGMLRCGDDSAWRASSLIPAEATVIGSEPHAEKRARTARSIATSASVTRLPSDFASTTNPAAPNRRVANASAVSANSSARHSSEESLTERAPAPPALTIAPDRRCRPARARSRSLGDTPAVNRSRPALRGQTNRTRLMLGTASKSRVPVHTLAPVRDDVNPSPRSHL